MCGIWALLSNLKEDFKNYQESFDSIKYRGPDTTCIKIINNNIYGFHRLAIHDLSVLGNQPFIWYDEDKTIVLIVNGEIYNYKELIEKYDLKLISNSDCEVIYHLYKKFNDINIVINLLHGEFAFILSIIENNNSIHYICRDPIGVRPLFYGYDNDKFIFSSLLSGITTSKNNLEHIDVFPPGNLLVLKFDIESLINYEFIKYYSYNYPIKYNLENSNLYQEITSRLIQAVNTRLDSEREIGALLSGGLDSSLICGIVSKILKVDNLRTFSIGMKKGTDLDYADKVAKHLNTNHTEIFFTPEEGLNAIDSVLETTETWDITTIRASVGQYLLGNYISKNTDIKVILNGDGADEVEMGYLYFYLAPNPEEAQKETIKLVEEIHRYDGLRVDRCISSHGLEARIPFLDTDFVDYYMSIDPELKIPTSKRMEKQLIRDAFYTLYPDILPNDVLYRKKEAFSDGISSKEKSWFEIIGEWIDTKISNEEYENRDLELYENCKSKESYYYKKYFNNRFGEKNTHVIPRYWLPNWIETNGEPSARVLQVYK